MDNLENEFEKHHVKALGWMLSSGLLEMKLAVVFNDDGSICDSETISEKGLFHQKVGILKDAEGNEIKIRGKRNIKPYLEERPEVWKRLYDKVYDKLSQKADPSIISFEKMFLKRRQINMRLRLKLRIRIFLLKRKILMYLQRNKCSKTIVFEGILNTNYSNQ